MTLWVSAETAALARNWTRMTEHEIALYDDRQWEKRKRRERSREIRRAWRDAQCALDVRPAFVPWVWA